MLGSTLSITTVSVGTTAKQLVGANSNRISVLLFNAGASTVFIGSSNTVSTTNGLPLFPQNYLVINTTGAVFGISQSGTNTVYVAQLIH